MEIVLTKPIEEFIKRQLEKGYADENEVAGQAFLRWMEAGEFEPDPPALAEKLAEARTGKFRPYEAGRYLSLIKEQDDAAR